MKRGNNPLVLCLFGILPVVWLGLLIAPAAGGGLPEILARFPAAMNDPFKIELCGDSLKTVLVLLCVYGLAIGVYLSSRRNYRRGEEHGSAKWGNARAVNKKYQAANPEENKILTQNVRMGFDGKKHRRSLNTVVVGGSGAGKTRFYAKPNLCQAANAASHGTSYVVLDPKGEMLRDTGYLLAQRGYDVRVLDLLNMEKSHCYNPFVYLRDDNDVQRLVTNLFKSTTPKGSQSNDPFWDTAASMLLLALVFYLKYEAPPDEQNFSMVMEMLRAADVREDIDEYASPLDELFERLEMRDPEHIAVKYYKDYHSGSAKTLKSIQITLAARLEKFNLSSLAALTAADELDLPSLGEKKVALFALIPDNDTSFNFLVSILSCANVFNVITTSLNMRKREFAVLRSVGMTVNKLFAMLCIENLRNGLLAILIGGISSLPLCYLIYKSIVVGAVIDFVFPLGAFVISSLAMFLIMFLTSLYGLWKIKNGDIIADVRNDFV